MEESFILLIKMGKIVNFDMCILPLLKIKMHPYIHEC